MKKAFFPHSIGYMLVAEEEKEARQEEGGERKGETARKEAVSKNEYKEGNTPLKSCISEQKHRFLFTSLRQRAR